MTLFFSNKVLRLVLAFSVSTWMTAGCLFGCGSTAMGAEALSTDTTAASADSCHAMRSHDCCAKAKTKKRFSTFKQGATSLAPAPRGMMSECPLLVGSTAATSKNGAAVPEPERAPVSVFPTFEKQIALADNTLVVPFLTNRGPTHLLVCVFLI